MNGVIKRWYSDTRSAMSRDTETELSQGRFSDMSSAGSAGKDKAAQYDYCMVLPSKDGELTEKGHQYVKKLRSLGLDMFAFEGITKDEIFILLRVSLELLRTYADDIDYQMLLDPEVLEAYAKKGNPDLNIAPINIEHMPEITAFTPYEKIFARYSRSLPEELYWRPEGMDHPFRDNVRLKLTATLIESRPPDGSENLKIKRYLRMKTIKAFFPLHNRAVCDELGREWLRNDAMPWEQPFFAIKEYFGEKIGLYFVFMGHYTQWLCIPAFVGIPVQLYVFIADEYSSICLPVFAFFLSMWSIVMLEYWKRKESMTSLSWGMVGYEDTERDRPDFKGKVIKSFIDGKPTKHYPSEERDVLVTQSSLIIFVMILLVIGVVVSIYIIKAALEPSIGSNAQTVASLCNAVQIQITNLLYGIVATALTDRENHRTETEHEDSMILKLFFFQFVNSYASFFYISFIASSLNDCGAGDECIKPLALNLAIIFGTRMTVGNIIELLLPYLSYKYKTLAQVLKGKKNPFMSLEYNLVRPEAEFLLDAYDVMESSLTDYAEIAIQFGYNALFVSALPMASFFALAANIMEVKGDAWKLLALFQRPVPSGAEDIGTWQTIFTVLAVAAVVTNAGLAVFTMTTFDQYSDSVRMWIFVVFQWLCFVSQAVIMEVIPDIPEEREIQLKRTQFLVDKIVDQVADDEVDPDALDGVSGDLLIEQYPLREVHGCHARKSTVSTNPMQQSKV